MIFKFISKKIPLKVKIFLLNVLKIKEYFLLNLKIKNVRKSQIQIVGELRKKEKINVIFLVIHDSVWKYEEIYKLLDNDSKFDVKLIVIPLVRDGLAVKSVYNQTLRYFINHEYETIPSYDDKNDSWIDIKALTNPDIVFFTNPHKLTFEQYYIDNFTDKLTCYVPYAFVVIHTLEMHYNLKIHHLLWRYFVETKYHSNYAKSYKKLKPKNVSISGFPGLDRIISEEYKPKKVWKSFRNGGAKKIIWAPHHTISGQGGTLNYSSFIEYSEFFISLLVSHEDIQIAFKPHPLLKEKLYVDKDWGKVKTDLYYERWDILPNGQLEEGTYIDLFYLSDGMITDSASFIVEYLYFDKPTLFTMRDESILDRFNSVGQRVFDYLYKAKNENDIIHFIEETVLKENDLLRALRNEFLKEVILPENGKTASENIYNELKEELC